ncbi:MAG: HAD family hydrolase [Anaerolineales bacterium]|nr:HAD family hydrolase [Anaerolineales bacterium]
MNVLKNFKADAIIFDKDGTLIDFDAMWGGWVIYLAEQLHQLSGLDVRDPLCLAMGYDDANKKVLATGKLAATPMHLLYRLTVEVMQSLGLSAENAEKVVAEGWYIPDPVILAKPFTDTRALFDSIHQLKIKIGIATTDDRAPTQAMIEAFDIEEYIATMVCSDDGIQAKPAPDMVLTICERMKVDPARVMVVGDTIPDLKMARAAGAGLVVGVLKGVSNTKDLAPFADALIESVNDLHVYIQEWAKQKAEYALKGLNPDIAF